MIYKTACSYYLKVAQENIEKKNHKEVAEAPNELDGKRLL